MEHIAIFQNTGTHRHIPERWNTASYSKTLEHSVIFQNTGIPSYTFMKTFQLAINANVCFRIFLNFNIKRGV
jgi:hypothetical protein